MNDDNDALLLRYEAHDLSGSEPVPQLLATPVRPAPVLISRFTVFDIMVTGGYRILGDPQQDQQLERYAFDKRNLF